MAKFCLAELKKRVHKLFIGSRKLGAFLFRYFKNQPDLDEIASKVFMSPFPFQRVFTEWVGISPKKIYSVPQIDYLRNKIGETETWSPQPNWSACPASQGCMTCLLPLALGHSSIKPQARDLNIFGYHATPFGLCFVAVAEKEFCRLMFNKKRKEEFKYFRAVAVRHYYT